LFVQRGPEKNCTKLYAPSFRNTAVHSPGYHQNVNKLTGNTKSGHILNTVIKYSLSGSWYETT